MADANSTAETYPLRTASRLTGLSPERLRAWERRHGIVVPLRTSGGTRRYTAADVEKLCLVKAAVDAGHRIGGVAQLDLEGLKRISAPREATSGDTSFNEIFAALDRLDGAEAQRLLSQHVSALGAVRFSREVALPLVIEIGERWTHGRIGIAHEHLASSVLRSLLGSALQPTASSMLGPRIVFATPTGERHELGLLMASLTALGAGANPLYLGAELPVEDLAGAAEEANAAVLALGIVSLPTPQALRLVGAVRGALENEIDLWIGGSALLGQELPEGVFLISSLEDLEHKVRLLGAGSS